MEQQFRADDVLPWDYQIPGSVDDDDLPTLAVDLALEASSLLALDEQQPLFTEKVYTEAYTDACIWYQPLYPLCWFPVW